MVTLKLAETADGFVAGGAHDPRLSITSAAANGAVHVMRAMHDAIMIGIGTALADDPLMTVRLPGVVAKPLRIVLDARAQLPPNSRLARHRARRAGAGAGGAGRAHRRALDGIDGLEIGRGGGEYEDGRLDLAAALALLAERGLTRVFIEGGPTIAGRLIAVGLADDVAIFTAAKTTRAGRGADAGAPEARETSGRSCPLSHLAGDPRDRRRSPARPREDRLMFTGLVSDVGTVLSRRRRCGRASPGADRLRLCKSRRSHSAPRSPAAGRA